MMERSKTSSCVNDTLHSIHMSTDFCRVAIAGLFNTQFVVQGLKPRLSSAVTKWDVV